MPLSAIVFGPAFYGIGLVSLALTVWAIVDTATKPEWAFRASGHSKTLWIVLEILGLFICGLVISLIYLLAIRPGVARAAAAGPSTGGWPGSAPWPPPPPGGGWTPQGWAPPPPAGGPGGAWDAPPAGGPGGAWDAPPAGGPGGAWGSSPPPPPPPPPAGGPPAGWYPNPSGAGGLQYWDGFQWTEHQRPN